MGADVEVHRQSQGKPLFFFGFQDPDLIEVPRDSPTLAAQAETLISQCVVSNKWKLASADIKRAFSSGDEEHCNIFILPPDDI